MQDPASFTAQREWTRAHPGQTSMLVLVESMGLPKAPEVLDWLRGRLFTQRLSSRWTVRQSDEAFRGTTTSGELRALCGLQGHYSRLDDTLAARCLPQMLAGQGTTSIGIHGFGLRMFDRNQWWPRIGLAPWQWPGRPQAQLPMSCNHAFPGVCDAAVLDLAVAQAQQPARFVYALTLDTHLPLDQDHAGPLPAELKARCAASGTPEEACHLVRKLGDVLGTLSQSLAGSRATPFVVVVGDHAPPFGEAANRQAFVADRVPIFVLTPLDAGKR
jgi:phosphoglycerol transferase MdoB-like AlkP superfamily enzyme